MLYLQQIFKKYNELMNDTNPKLNALKDKIEIIEDDDAICMGTSNIANVVENIFNEREHRELRQAQRAQNLVSKKDNDLKYQHQIKCLVIYQFFGPIKSRKHFRKT